MNIKETLEEITRIEREKAQLELRQTQLAAKQEELAKQLAGLGVSPKDLENEIKRLSDGIQEKLSNIRKTTNKVSGIDAVDEEIIPVLED